MALRRRQGQRQVKTTILIVGEGKKTEPIYFDGLKREEAVSRAFAVTVKKGPGYSAEAVVKAAIDLRRGGIFDQVWCVIDVEGPAHAASLKAAMDLAAQEGITLCLSNPAFEVWLLAHFERRAGLFKDCDAVITDLSKHWQKAFGTDYEKNDQRIYEKLETRTNDAIANAQTVYEKEHTGKSRTDRNSSSEVYQLVKRLLGR